MRVVLILLSLVVLGPYLPSADAQIFRRSYSGRCGNANCVMCYGRPEPNYEAPIPDDPAKAPTPQVVVDKILQILDLPPDVTIADLGCGDGRVVITAAKRYGCRGIGIERDSQQAKVARQKVVKAGLDDLITINCGDARKFILADVEVVYLYLYPELIKELLPRLQLVDVVVSYQHPLPKAARIMIDGHPVYIKHQGHPTVLPVTKPLPVAKPVSATEFAVPPLVIKPKAKPVCTVFG